MTSDEMARKIADMILASMAAALTANMEQRAREQAESTERCARITAKIRSIRNA
jgi:hypothetical protein